jgi:hypothetical protein
MLTLTVQYQFFCSWSTFRGRHKDPLLPLEMCSNWRWEEGWGWVSAGGREGGLRMVAPSPVLLGVEVVRGDARTHVAPAPARTLDLPSVFSFVCYSLFLISFPLAAKLNKDQ